jgi:hypothetical protein
LLDALVQETVVVVPPIEVRLDRTMRLTLVGHPNDLGAILETVPDGVSLEVLWARLALEVARALGYYEVPRRNGIEAVSTASELLRRGEARTVEGVLDGEP